MTAYRVDFSAMPWRNRRPGVRDKAYEEDGRQVRLVEFATSDGFAEWCTEGHIGYVLDGSLEIDVNGTSHHCVAGDGLFLPSGSAHAHRAVTITPGTRLLMVEELAPARRAGQPSGSPAAAAEGHDVLLREAIALAAEARAAGNHPFGALLAIDGRSVLTATNTVVSDADPTAHAETNLIGRAVRELPPALLARAVLYTSCEPCAMCVGKIYWAGIRSLVYALSTTALAGLAGGRFVMPCRELLARASEPVSVIGPLLEDEAREAHRGFWPEHGAVPARG